MGGGESPQPSDEHSECRFITFSMLVSLFECAFLLLHEVDKSAAKERRWLSWEGYMREWCQRADFRRMLPTLLRGENKDFASCIRALAAQENGSVDRNTTYLIADATNTTWSPDLRSLYSDAIRRVR